MEVGGDGGRCEVLREGLLTDVPAERTFAVTDIEEYPSLAGFENGTLNPAMLIENAMPMTVIHVRDHISGSEHRQDLIE